MSRALCHPPLPCSCVVDGIGPRPRIRHLPIHHAPEVDDGWASASESATGLIHPAVLHRMDETGVIDILRSENSWDLPWLVILIRVVS